MLSVPFHHNDWPIMNGVPATRRHCARITIIMTLGVCGAIGVIRPADAQQLSRVVRTTLPDSDIARAERARSNGHTDSAITYAMRARDVARSRKQDSLAVIAADIAVMANISLGKLDVAAALAREEMRLARVRSDTSAQKMFMISLTGIEVLTGQVDSAASYLQELRMWRLTPDDSTVVAHIAQSLYTRLQTLGDRRIRQLAGVPGIDPLPGNVKMLFDGPEMRDSARQTITRVRQMMLSRDMPGDDERFNRAMAMVGAFITLREADSALAYAERARAVAPPVFAAMAQAGVARAEVMRGSRPSLERAVLLYDSALVAMARTAPRLPVLRAQYAEAWSILQRRVVQTLLALDEPEAALAASDVSYLQRADSDLTRGNARVELAARGRMLIQRAARTGLTHVVFAPLFDELVTWTISPDRSVIVTRNTTDLNWLASAPYKLRSMLESEAGVESDRMQDAWEYDPGFGSSDQMPGATDARMLARQIASVLLPPETAVLLPDSGEIVIVGTGPIGLIPFAALPRSSAASGDSTSGLLGDRLAIRTLWALSDISSDMQANDHKDRTAATGSPLVFGDPLAGRSAELMVMQPNMTWQEVHIPALPNARAEAIAIGAMLGARPVLGAAATRARFIGRLGDATLVHFAGHAFASDADESLMYLQFAVNGDTAGTRLRARDILSPTTPALHASLVTLSACESGTGEARWTQGTLGLQRAFLQRGAVSVLSSLWRVRDVATRILMETFYKEWLFAPDHPDKAEALRRAETRVRSIPGYESPAYWAGWQLTGAQ